MIWFAMLPAAAIQLWLCFRGKRLILRLLPLAGGLTLLLASWGGCFAMGPNTALDVVAGLFLAGLAGFWTLLGAALSWVLYGLVRFVQKIGKKFGV